MDMIGGSLGLLLLSPLLLAIAVAVRLDSDGPVFYRSIRVGLHGKEFEIFKFRTMIVNADQIGPAITVSEDRRVTPVGRFLRKWKLDELPQLINVVNGTMSLVGPRPESPRYVALYTPEQRRVLLVRPGITSLASLSFRNEEHLLVGPSWEDTYVNVVMPAKLNLDLDYIDRVSVLRDFQIIAQTILAIVR